jgi:tRNA-splicing ligase RtcB
MRELFGSNAKAVVMIDEIDEETYNQILAMIGDRSFFSPIRIMPDCHKGEGSVIGFTMPIPEDTRIIPNIVGVDQSCGMLSFLLDRGILGRFSRGEINRLIRERVPLGMNVNKKPFDMVEFGWDILNKKAEIFTRNFNKRYGTNHGQPYYNIDWFDDLCERIGIDRHYAECSIGSLGGGNHFIEFGIDEGGHPWLTIHTGSRNLGLRTANYWQRKAEERAKEFNAHEVQKVIEQIKSTRPKTEWQEMISFAKRTFNIKEGFEFLKGNDSFGYLTDALFCNQYATENRHAISTAIDEVLDLWFIDKIETIHNYIDPRDFIIRKGAVASYKDERFILPFNMEDGMFICEGLSNPEWNFSSPHGAGRVLSRTKANELLKADDARKSMDEKGIFTSELPTDELKGAYKPMAIIEAAIAPTAKILHRIKPIINIKAPSEKRREKKHALKTEVLR